MKKLFRFVVAVVAIMAMASCGGGGNTPKGVTEQFIKAIQKQDGKKMAELVYFKEDKAPKTDAEKEQLAAMMQSKVSTTYANNGELKSTKSCRRKYRKTAQRLWSRPKWSLRRRQAKTKSSSRKTPTATGRLT